MEWGVGGVDQDGVIGMGHKHPVINLTEKDVNPRAQRSATGADPEAVGTQ